MLTSLFMLPVLVAGMLAADGMAQASCDLAVLGVAPLTDMTLEYAPGVPGGLYPGGLNTRPLQHEAAGVAIASDEILPLDVDGLPDPNGIVGMVSIGMSNATQEFDGGPWAFKPRADADPSRNPSLVIVDGAQASQDAGDWAVTDSLPWQVLAQRLADAGVAPSQVQVVWLKQAIAEGGALGFPYGATLLHDHLREIVAILSQTYPNVRLVYLSSRSRAWELGPSGTNPEPLAFESGFAVRWLIQDQLDGDPALAFAGPGAQAPWLSWGPYLWADGVQPRSDGLTWLATDVVSDCTHPSQAGETKVADQLLAFFKTDPTTTPWFLREQPGGMSPLVAVSTEAVGGPAPFTAGFEAFGLAPYGSVQEFAWTFDDGTYAYGATPTKTFAIPGEYQVRVTATDDLGHTTQRTLQVVVGGGPWTGLGHALPGSSGQPLLVADGTLLAGGEVTLTHLNLPPDSPGMTMLGLSAIDVPFRGGVLVPDPVWPIAGLTTGDGTLQLIGRWPANVPSGLSLYIQTWVVDLAGPAGIVATNAVVGISP